MREAIIQTEPGTTDMGGFEYSLESSRLVEDVGERAISGFNSVGRAKPATVAPDIPYSGFGDEQVTERGTGEGSFYDSRFWHRPA